MKIGEAYEHALKNGRAKIFSTFYVRLLNQGKAHADAVEQAVAQMELSAEDAFSPSARALYALHYRRSIERGADEYEARKIALEHAMRAVRR
jgi:hypothetical protein